MSNESKNKIIKKLSIVNQDGFNDRQWAILIGLLILSIVIGS